MSKPRASYRYFGSQNRRKYQAESLMNLAKTSTWTVRMLRSRENDCWPVRRASSRGERHRVATIGDIHQITHAMPRLPAKKTSRHPIFNRMIPISGGASTEPTAVPALMIPIAVERSSGAIHSETTRVAAGKRSALAHTQQESRCQQQHRSPKQAHAACTQSTTTT